MLFLETRKNERRVYSSDSSFFFFFVSSSGSDTPASVRVKITSCSGWCGLSTILAILFFPDFLKYTLYVLECATTFPPIGLVGSPKNESGDDITWFVAIDAILYVSA